MCAYANMYLCVIPLVWTTREKEFIPVYIRVYDFPFSVFLVCVQVDFILQYKVSTS